MKHCNSCRIDVATPAVCCPLCGAPLIGTDEPDDVYPSGITFKKRGFVRKLLLLISFLCTLICFTINLFATPGFWWWTIVATALCYAWIVVPHAMRRGGNSAGKVLMQVVAGSLLAVAIDFETGYNGWAVSYAVPAFICTGITAVVVLVLINRTNWAGYVLYQSVLTLFGLAMPILYFTGFAQNAASAFTPSVFALASIAGLLIFGDRSIKNEFRRRLHF